MDDYENKTVTRLRSNRGDYVTRIEDRAMLHELLRRDDIAVDERAAFQGMLAAGFVALTREQRDQVEAVYRRVHEAAR
jgi:hypothetical protein